MHNAVKEDCSNLHELPTMFFEIDGHRMELPPQAYVMRVTGATLEADDIWDILFFKPKIRQFQFCSKKKSQKPKNTKVKYQNKHF